MNEDVTDGRTDRIVIIAHQQRDNNREIVAIRKEFRTFTDLFFFYIR